MSDLAAKILMKLSECSPDKCIGEEDLFRAVAETNSQDSYNAFLDEIELMVEEFHLERRLKDGELFYRGIKED